eukprot:Pgem_evm2s20210
MVDLSGAKITIGYYTLCNNAVVDWKVKQTNNVAIQKNEAESIAAMAGFRATQYIINIIAPEPTSTASNTCAHQ